MGLLSALQHTGGLWFGWSGETTDKPSSEPAICGRGHLRFATIDLEPAEFDAYYNGYCNSTLWPLFHYLAAGFKHEQSQYEAYQRVNRRFAQALRPLLQPDDMVWIHDYQLLSLGRYLRELAFKGPIGFFLHIPFPHREVLRLLPEYRQLVRDLCQCDLLGFQTDDDVHSFLSCLDLPEGFKLPQDGRFLAHARELRVGTYPIGIDVESVVSEAQTTLHQETVQRMIASLLGRKLIIGVDRLDYSKGLTQRFAAFEQFLETYPDNQGKVTFLQIAPLSRSDVLAYTEIRHTLEQNAGRVNGRFAAADWTPIRYLNRNFTRPTTMGFLRAAQVALVTPVRDGMNLVAKEFVAAQDPEDPGVLILSPLAGAARELGGALLVNPYDKPGMARALQSALEMPLEERRARHRQMFEAVRRHDIHDWYNRFVFDLAGERLDRSPQPESYLRLPSRSARSLL